jgi:hypothetical protein
VKNFHRFVENCVGFSARKAAELVEVVMHDSGRIVFADRR